MRMKAKLKLLAAAVAAAGMASAGAAPLPERTTFSVDDNPREDIKFAGGATVNKGAGFMKLIPSDTPVDAMFSVEVADEDVGRDGDLFLVIRTDNGWFQKTANGYAAWNTNLDSLNPYTTKILSAHETARVEDIEATVGMDLDGTRIAVYFGYASDATPLTYTGFFDVHMDGPPPEECPAGTEFLAGVDKDLCVLSGTYTSDLRLRSNFDYVLSGGVFIGGDNADSAAITIDPGVRVMGESGSDFLVINRGSKIHANGTPDAPIIMTSANDADATSSTRGQWGGLIINGNAPINGCSEGTVLCEAQGEGSTGLFGGNDPNDSSGNLNYLQLRYAGFEITPENELNGIAFQGVGDGTNVDYVQVHNNADDGVEFFGGTVNARHLMLTGIADDSLDWVLGWQGKAQYVVAVQTDIGDQGIEADNNSANRDSQPRSRPMIANMTLLGNANGDLGVLLREGTGANLINSVVSGFGDACMDIDNAATFDNAGSSATNLTGELTMTHSVVDCEVNFDEELEDNWSVEAWFVNQAGNVAGGAGMDSYINSAAVNEVMPGMPEGSFLDQVDFVGAVKDSENDWTRGWTFRQFEEFID